MCLQEDLAKSLVGVQTKVLFLLRIIYFINYLRNTRKTGSGNKKL